MKFSVITPSYRQPEWLRLCCASVADQLPPAGPHAVEHIVQDACSGAEVRAVCADFPGVQLFQEQDAGMYDAINRGWERARGDILCWLNSDEQYLPGTLAKVAAAFAAHPEVDIIFGSMLLIDADGALLAFRKAMPLRWPYVLAAHLYAPSCTMFFRRRFFEEGFRFDTRWRTVGDVDLVVRLLQHGFQALHLDDYLAGFTQTGDNLGATALAAGECQQLLRAAPAWVRWGRPLLQAARWGEKLLHGCYRQSWPLTYALFTRAAPAVRRTFSVDRGSSRWRPAKENSARPVTKVLVVGQTPPPWGGQAVMIEQLLHGRFASLKLYLARMNFSEEMNEIGAFRFKKMGRLFSLLFKIIWMRCRYRTPVLYYPPASPQRLPMYRDFFLLIFTRWLFRHTVFHFHAGGISELYGRLSGWERWLFRRAYFRPDCAIRPSSLNPPDGAFLQARHDVVVVHGLPDRFGPYAATAEEARRQREMPNFLFAGLLCESKGVLVLLKACERLKRRNVAFALTLIGRFASGDFERNFRAELEARDLRRQVVYAGEQRGDDRWPSFAAADAFVFPSFFEAESFGLVVLEAMQFALPVVATQWRGIPTLVREGETGLLVPIQDDERLAAGMEQLATHPDLRTEMGRQGRERYLREFTVERWYAGMEQAILQAVQPNGGRT